MSNVAAAFAKLAGIRKALDGALAETIHGQRAAPM
jgi:hypothetical protein